MIVLPKCRFIFMILSQFYKTYDIAIPIYGSGDFLSEWKSSNLCDSRNKTLDKHISRSQTNSTLQTLLILTNINIVFYFKHHIFVSCKLTLILCYTVFLALL